MTPRDFCYWLQGYFELGGGIHYNAAAVQEAIQNHLNLVNETIKNSPDKYDERMIRFIGWMESAIELKGDAKVVQTKLNTIFEHVIDPSVPGDQGALNQIHLPGNDVTYRC